MVFQPPTRTVPASKSGPRLDYTPQQVADLFRDPSGHGLSAAICKDKGWEPFAWKGQDMSAWMRTLYAAEHCGLVSIKPDGTSTRVHISDIVNHTNEYLTAFGKRPVAESTILNQLRQARAHLMAALRIRLEIDATSNSVYVLDQVHSVNVLEDQYKRLQKKAMYINEVIENSNQLGHDLRGVLAKSPEFMRLAGNVAKALEPAA